MVIGESYMKNMVSQVLPAIEKEVSTLRTEAMQTGSDVAKELYCKYIDASVRMIGKFMELKKQEISEIGKAWEFRNG